MFPFPGLSNQGLKLEANVELKTPKNWPGFEPALRWDLSRCSASKAGSCRWCRRRRLWWWPWRLPDPWSPCRRRLPISPTSRGRSSSGSRRLRPEASGLMFRPDQIEMRLLSLRRKPITSDNVRLLLTWCQTIIYQVYNVDSHLDAFGGRRWTWCSITVLILLNVAFRSWKQGF